MPTEVPATVACPYCDPEDNQFMQRMRIRSNRELRLGGQNHIVVAVYRCERCGRTRDETFAP